MECHGYDTDAVWLENMRGRGMSWSRHESGMARDHEGVECHGHESGMAREHERTWNVMVATWKRHSSGA